jgi:exosortase/archaeosortase family protein
MVIHVTLKPILVRRRSSCYDLSSNANRDPFDSCLRAAKMAKKGRKPHSGMQPDPGNDAHGRPHGDRRDTGAGKSWFERNRRDIRFLTIFATVLLVYFGATLTPPVKNWFFPAYLRLNAQVSGGLLRALGQNVKVEDRAISISGGATLQIERGCDAVDPSALFVAAVIASPVRWTSRFPAALGGTLLLMVLNLARVVSLFFVRLHYPKAFDFMHLDVWQALFIFLAILLWGLWASRASRTALVLADG